MALQQEFKETTHSLELIYFWYEPYHMIGCIFFLVWDVFSLAMLSPVLTPLFKGQMLFPKNIFAWCSFFLLVPAPTYWMVLYLTNKTKVYLSRSRVTITNGPLPCLRKNKSLMLRNISHIYIKEHRNNPLFNNTWHIKKDQTCSVKAVMKNGESRYIFQNMENPEDALIVSSRIKSWLIEMNRFKFDEGQIKTPSVPHYNKQTQRKTWGKEP